MATDDYEYSGLMAEFWDFFRGDTSNWSDRSFYRDLIAESGQPALDVGCGTGRLLLDYLADGVDIDGVDNSPDMLRICRQKAEALGLKPALYQQVMEALDVPRRYRSIIVPSSSFQLVTDPAAAERAMERFFAHLEPGGRLAMPFMVTYLGDDPGPIVREEWGEPREKVRESDGALVRRWSRSTYDLAEQLEHSEDRYEVSKDGVVLASEHHSRSPAVRWYTQAQAVALYERAGFANVRVLSEFTRQPVTPTDTIFSVLGTRP